MKQKHQDRALDRLADMMPLGHLQASTDPAGFLHAVADRIVELERELSVAKSGEKLREAMDLIAMRQCPRGDFRCPETGDCITEWCEGCIGRRALDEDKEQQG